MCQRIGRSAGSLRRRWWAVAALAAGCSADPPPACITVDTSCAPLYAPTFDNIYTMTLRDTCGSQSASCHSAVGMQGGMSFQDQQHAFDALLAGRVVPGNPGCSKMIVRTDSPGASYQMPPGDPLSEPARCALIQWVAMGAPAGSASSATGGAP
ncbi:MAG TPA: c-type cytochrome domain-containing protein [Kofleriaceae bacterium]|nr:c-type cytochrome domain-containing protein [Kofleriaceae bacterium]